MSATRHDANIPKFLPTWRVLAQLGIVPGYWGFCRHREYPPMSESPLTRQGLPPVLADLVRFYCSLNFLAELCYSAKRDPLFGFGRIFGQTAEYSTSAGCWRIFGTPLLAIMLIRYETYFQVATDRDPCPSKSRPFFSEYYPCPGNFPE